MFSSLLHKVFGRTNGSGESVSVIIGVRNRFDHRIENAIRSIRYQDYDPALIQIVVVDYGSDPACARAIETLCATYDCDFVHVPGVSAWNRGACVNIGLKKATGTYVLVTDVDVIFENNYLRVAVDELKKNPNQLLFCSVTDLPQGAVAKVIDDLAFRYESLKQEGTDRRALLNPEYEYYGLGIAMTQRKLLERVGGFDERYELWGSEDEDLAKRLRAIGVGTRNIGDKTSILHQWHPKYEGVADDPEHLEKTIARNRERLSGA